jgi:hypothetical protein
VSERTAGRAEALLAAVGSRSRSSAKSLSMVFREISGTSFDAAVCDSKVPAVSAALDPPLEPGSGGPLSQPREMYAGQGVSYVEHPSRRTQRGYRASGDCPCALRTLPVRILRPTRAASFWARLHQHLGRGLLAPDGWRGWGCVVHNRSCRRKAGARCQIGNFLFEGTTRPAL